MMKIEHQLKGYFDEYEIYSLKEKSKRFESRDGELFEIDIKEEKGIALRGIKEGKLFFSYSYQDERGVKDDLLKNLTPILPYLDSDKNYGFPSSFGDYPALEVLDRKGLSERDEIKAGMVVEMEREILSFDSRIVKTRACELVEGYMEIEIFNSKGLSVRAEKTLYSLFALAVARDRDEASFHDWIGSTHLENLDHIDFGRQIAKKAISFLNAETIKTGIYEGIITPKAMVELLKILSFSFLSENLFKKKTKLKGKEGKRCFSPFLSIHDSGLSGIGALPFDGEGVPSQEKVLVKEGYFLDFVYDFYYGKKLGKASTGNAVRSHIKEMPRCGIRGLCIKPGKNDIREKMENGIAIEELMGSHTANPVTGDFSLGANGFLVRNKKISPFRGIIFAGNVFELFNNVLEVGNDPKTYGLFSSPSIAFSNIKISGE